MSAGPLSAPAVVSEQQRILTVMARFIGIGFFAYFLVAIPELGTPAGLVADWYPPVSVVLVLAPAAFWTRRARKPFAWPPIPRQPGRATPSGRDSTR